MHFERCTPEQDEVNSLKVHFLAALNHEIRTPLAGIMGLVDLLSETPLSAEQKELLQATRDCVDTLHHTLTSILEYSALAAGKIRLSESEFPLRQLLRGAAERFRTQAEEKGLRFRVLVDESVPELAVGDPLRLQQLLTQIVSNAVKFTHDGSVTVDAAAEPAPDGRTQLNVTVMDTGIGIPPDKRHAIFESFQQIESGLSRGYPGLGLGLALAQKLAQLLGGTLDFDSTPGEGSRFSFSVTLPVAVSKATTESPAKEAAYRILVVEDNKVAREVVQHVLRRRPYDVRFAESGQRAIEEISSTTFDLILMDLQMPGMDGIEATQEIRKRPAYKDVPILALTANDSPEYQEMCRRLGMQGFLVKPVQADEVLRTLDTLLVRNARRRDQSTELHTPAL
jgi:CheY-like chemotaxis protein